MSYSTSKKSAFETRTQDIIPKEQSKEPIVIRYTDEPIIQEQPVADQIKEKVNDWGQQAKLKAVAAKEKVKPVANQAKEKMNDLGQQAKLKAVSAKEQMNDWGQQAKLKTVSAKEQVKETVNEWGQSADAKLIKESKARQHGISMPPALLDEIRQGKQLRHVKPTEQKISATPASSFAMSTLPAGSAFLSVVKEKVSDVKDKVTEWGQAAKAKLTTESKQTQCECIPLSPALLTEIRQGKQLRHVKPTEQKISATPASSFAMSTSPVGSASSFLSVVKEKMFDVKDKVTEWGQAAKAKLTTETKYECVPMPPALLAEIRQGTQLRHVKPTEQKISATPASSFVSMSSSPVGSASSFLSVVKEKMFDVKDKVSEWGQAGFEAAKAKLTTETKYECVPMPPALLAEIRQGTQLRHVKPTEQKISATPASSFVSMSSSPMGGASSFFSMVKEKMFDVKDKVAEWGQAAKAKLTTETKETKVPVPPALLTEIRQGTQLRHVKPTEQRISPTPASSFMSSTPVKSAFFQSASV